MTKYVYVPQDLVQINLANLSDFGNIRFVMPEQTHTWSEGIEEQILNGLESFDPVLDFLACSGRMTIANVILGTAVAEYGCVNVLLFDNVTRKYKAKEIGCYEDL